MSPEAAKEIRIFGLLDWVGARFSAAAMAGVLPVWRQRRRIFYGPYVLYTLVAFVLLGGVLAGAARATAGGVARHRRLHDGDAGRAVGDPDRRLHRLVRRADRVRHGRRPGPAAVR